VKKVLVVSADLLVAGCETSNEARVAGEIVCRDSGGFEGFADAKIWRLDNARFGEIPRLYLCRDGAVRWAKR
jgi:hypothetical protein